MDWLNRLVDELVAHHQDEEIIVESGVSPSGTYHVGHLREVLTADVIRLELERRGLHARHIHFVDDLDALRKVPVNIPPEYEQYLGKPISDIPAPDGSDKSYSDYFLSDFLESISPLGLKMEVIKSHEKYRSGFFKGAIEQTLAEIKTVRSTLKDVAGRELNEQWSPIQIMEEGYLKNRRYLRIDTDSGKIFYEGKDGSELSTSYAQGEVKLDWRIDWPARWTLLKISAEPFGRDHATKGGSYDTGVALSKAVFHNEPPIPIPYDFINRAGDTKKMSASKGTGIALSEVIKVLPPEVLRYFIVRYSPDKLLFFDQGNGTVKLIDEFAALAAKEDPTEQEKQLLYISTGGLGHITVSPIPFSHLVASYQAALKDVDKTLQVLSRTEYADIVVKDQEVIKSELAFIDEWLKRWAPDDVKFDLIEKVNSEDFNNNQRQYLSQLAEKIEKAPADADGEWFHKAIYEFKETGQVSSQELFSTLYRVLIGKTAGPRAGWFLSILPRDWLIKRLRFEA
jgi:lysyl-tRNA synthetase class 1